VNQTEFDALVEQAKKNVAEEVQRRVKRYADLMAEELVEAEVDRLARERGGLW
jgi:F0F1-type ATP synthase membrane subunit b/b'